MKIRAITLGQSLQGGPKLTTSLNNLKDSLLQLQTLKKIFTQKRIEVQYIRLATEPFTNNADQISPTFYNQGSDIVIIVEKLENFVKEGILVIYPLSPGV